MTILIDIFIISLEELNVRIISQRKGEKKKNEIQSQYKTGSKQFISQLTQGKKNKVMLLNIRSGFI